MKDLKQDDEKELRVDVAYSKSKRARWMMLDAFKGIFATKYSKLKPYANELKRIIQGVQSR